MPFRLNMSAPYSLNVTVGVPFTSAATDESSLPLVHWPSQTPVAALHGRSFTPGMAPSIINMRSLQNGQ